MARQAEHARLTAIVASADGEPARFQGGPVSRVESVDRSDQVNPTDHPAFDCAPAWSPDGTKLVTDRDGDDNDEVCVMDADGSNPTSVTNHPAQDFASSWTSDGTRLIFDTNRDGNWELYSIGVDGTSPVRLTTHLADDEFPAWRP